jgi:hypothetical protein
VNGGGWHAPAVVLLLTAVLSVAAAAAVATSAATPASEPLLATPLPGLGRTADLSRCPAAFDPRLGGACGLRHGPLPGADPLCPDHPLEPLPESR